MSAEAVPKATATATLSSAAQVLLTTTKLASHLLDLASRGQSFSRIGHVLIAINTRHFGSVQPRPGPEGQALQIDTSISECYAVCDELLRKLAKSRNPQMIVHTGVSGSGKSFVTWKELAYLLYKAPAASTSRFTSVEGNGHGNEAVGKGGELDGLIDRLYTTCKAGHSLLDRFGNATTPANPSSSRFGRFIKIIYYIGTDGTPRPCGAAIETFAWEKTRVNLLRADETTFHILDHTRPLDPDCRREFKQFFPDVGEADTAMGILDACAAILQAGEENFVEMEMHDLASKLGVDAVQLHKLGATRQGLLEYVAGEYERLFQLVVQRVNAALKEIARKILVLYQTAFGGSGPPEGLDELPWLCIVDSPGREYLPVNGLDQAIYNIWSEVLLSSHFDGLATELATTTLSFAAGSPVNRKLDHLSLTSETFKPLLQFLDSVSNRALRTGDEHAAASWAKLEKRYRSVEGTVPTPKYDHASKTLQITDHSSELPTIYDTTHMARHNAASTPKWATLSSAHAVWRDFRPPSDDPLASGHMSARARYALRTFMSYYGEAETVRTVCCVRPDVPISGVPCAGAIGHGDMRQGVIVQLDHLGMGTVLQLYGYHMDHAMTVDHFVQRYAPDVSGAGTDDVDPAVRVKAVLGALDSSAQWTMVARPDAQLVCFDAETHRRLVAHVRESRGMLGDEHLAAVSADEEDEHLELSFRHWGPADGRGLDYPGGKFGKMYQGRAESYRREAETWEDEAMEWRREAEDLKGQVKDWKGEADAQRAAAEGFKGQAETWTGEAERLELALDNLAAAHAKEMAIKDSTHAEALALQKASSDRLVSDATTRHSRELAAIKGELRNVTKESKDSQRLLVVTFQRFVQANVYNFDGCFDDVDGQTLTANAAQVAEMRKQYGEDARRYIESTQTMPPHLVEGAFAGIGNKAKIISHAIPHLGILHAWLAATEKTEAKAGTRMGAGPQAGAIGDGNGHLGHSVSTVLVRKMITDLEAAISLRLGDELKESVRGGGPSSLSIAQVDMCLRQLLIVAQTTPVPLAPLLQAPFVQVLNYIHRSLEGRAEYAGRWHFGRADVQAMAQKLCTDYGLQL